MLVVREGRRERPSTGRPWAGGGDFLLGSGHPGWLQFRAGVGEGKDKTEGEEKASRARAHGTLRVPVLTILEAPSRRTGDGLLACGVLVSGVLCFSPAIRSTGELLPR